MLYLIFIMKQIYWEFLTEAFLKTSYSPKDMQLNLFSLPSPAIFLVAQISYFFKKKSNQWTSFSLLLFGDSLEVNCVLSGVCNIKLKYPECNYLYMLK